MPDAKAGTAGGSELLESLSEADLALQPERVPPEHAHEHVPVPAGSHSPEAAAAEPHGHAAHQGGTNHAHGEVPTWADFVGAWDIYQAPVVCGALAGCVLGLLGVFIVLRRAIFITAAVSQAAGLGVALTFLLAIHAGIELPPVLGALLLAVLATALLAVKFRSARLPAEAALGLAFISASALAVLVGDRISQEAHDIASILFGTAVLVRPLDLALVAAGGAMVVLVVLATYRGLVFAGFDPEGARVQGLPVRGLEALLWALVAIEVSVATRALGSLPVFAFAVIPAMTALMLVKRLPASLVLAAALGSAAGALGYVFAFFFAFPVGASQATLSVLCFLLALPFGVRRRAA